MKHVISTCEDLFWIGGEICSLCLFSISWYVFSAAYVCDDGVSYNKHPRSKLVR